MLTINIWGRGKEYYAVFYPLGSFDEDNFMNNHSEDYMDLEVGIWTLKFGVMAWILVSI